MAPGGALGVWVGPWGAFLLFVTHTVAQLLQRYGFWGLRGGLGGPLWLLVAPWVVGVGHWGLLVVTAGPLVALGVSIAGMLDVLLHV